MARKPRKLPVHYIAMTFRDGAAVGCMPTRKPSEKKIKTDGLRIDPDLVCQEMHYAPGQYASWEQDFRVRCADLLTNRLNMRRTTRELVLPVLAEIQTTLIALNKRLEQIERALAMSSSSMNQTP